MASPAGRSGALPTYRESWGTAHHSCPPTGRAGALPTCPPQMPTLIPPSTCPAQPSQKSGLFHLTPVMVWPYPGHPEDLA